MKFRWDKAMVSRMKALLKAGHTADSASAVMRLEGTGITANAIVGKAYRLGLPFPGRAEKPKKPVDPKPPKVKPPKPVPEAMPLLVGGSRCLYIMTDIPADREFCGKPAVANPYSRAGYAAWCEEHLKVVYQKVVPYRSKAVVPIRVRGSR